MTPGKVLIKFSHFLVERVWTVHLFLLGALFLLINVTNLSSKRGYTERLSVGMDKIL